MSILKVVAVCVSFVCGLTFPVAITVLADCFDYRADSHSEPTVIRNVKQSGSETVDDTLSGQTVRKSIWIPATDYVAVQMSSAYYQPQIFITRQDGTEVVAQSLALEKNEEGHKFAEAHFSGAQAHKGGDGWVDIVFSSDPKGEKGAFRAWIYKIERMRDVPEDYCNASFIPYQGSHECDTCAPPSDDLPPDCPPGFVMFLGNCIPE